MGDDARPVYFEFTVIGATVKVVAIDSATGVEVTVMGPSNASRQHMERLALAKLKGRLAREGA